MVTPTKHHSGECLRDKQGVELVWKVREMAVLLTTRMGSGIPIVHGWGTAKRHGREVSPVGAYWSEGEVGE